MSSEKIVDNKEKSVMKKKRCFVITPIGDEMSPIRRHIEGIIDAAIEPALGDRYEIIVSHRIFEQGLITKQIITEIYQDELIIANLTDRNPNVMYELALCHALGKPVIMIAEKNTSLPADIIMQRTIFYYNDAQGVLELSEELKKSEQEIKYGQKTGPIIDILGDISHDVTLLQQFKKEKGSDIDQMEYIINRLNRIEDIVTSSNLRLESQNISHCEVKQLIYDFENTNIEITPNTLKNKLNGFITTKYIDTRIVNVNIDENKGLLDFSIQISSRYSLAELNKDILIYLTKIGVKGVNPNYCITIDKERSDVTKIGF